MSEHDDANDRDARLAERLRANLRRRKAHTRTKGDAARQPAADLPKDDGER